MPDSTHAAPAPATPPNPPFGNPTARGPVPPMRTQPTFQPLVPGPQGPQAAPGGMPPAAGGVPPAGAPGGAGAGMPGAAPAGPGALGGPGAPAVPVMPLGGVPFTIICPEGYLPVIKFIKIPERAPRPEETPGGAVGSGTGAPAAPSPTGSGR